MELIKTRNRFNRFGYKKILKPVFFKFDPEKMHNLFNGVGRFLGSNFFTKWITNGAFNYQNRALEQKILGITFRNPIGLAGGFDKSAQIISIMEDVGFGFVEVGSVTAKAHNGNEGHRLKRIVDEKGLWVNYGLNNRGADEIHGRLKRRRYNVPFGVNVARTNSKDCVPDEAGIKDYIYTLRKFEDVGDYFTINISCPNAFGARNFAKPELYETLMKEIYKLKIKKPVFVKLSPDITKEEADKMIKISSKYGVKGFIISNLTKSKGKSGGYSGKMVEKKANSLLKYVYSKTKGRFVLIGLGGIFSAEDAYRKIKMGANLVQLITGMIYEGPGLIGEINFELAELLKKDGFKNISEAVGAEFR
jgi:dihydroorotate dehydrogenase